MPVIIVYVVVVLAIFTLLQAILSAFPAEEKRAAVSLRRKTLADGITPWLGEFARDFENVVLLSGSGWSPTVWLSGMAGLDMAPRSIRSQIASAIHVVVQLARGSDGKRRLTSIHEITGMEGDVITANEIFRFRRTSTDPEGVIHGYYESTGIRPRFAEDLATQNLVLPANIFAQNRRLE